MNTDDKEQKIVMNLKRLGYDMIKQAEDLFEVFGSEHENALQLMGAGWEVLEWSDDIKKGMGKFEDV